MERLKDGAITDGDGTTWATDGRVMRSPGGGVTWFSMGMPQGSLAVICFLAFAAQAGIPGAMELLHSSASWLHAQRMSQQAGQCFPIGVDRGLKIPPQRLAWCSGDLPVAPTLLQAGSVAAERTWVDTAREVALLAVALPVARTIECSLCHGDSGIGLTFAFLHNVIGGPALADASERWFASALARRIRGQPYEGYRTLLEPPWSSTRKIEQHWTSSGQLLRGAGGIALALLAASGPRPPEWAGALMLPWNSMSASGGRVP